MTKKEAVNIKQLAEIVTNLATTIDTLIDSNIHVAQEVKLHKEECINLCNRVNEIELSLEDKRTPLVRPVVKRKRPVEVKTPYPKKRDVLTKAYYKLKRIINAST